MSSIFKKAQHRKSYAPIVLFTAHNLKEIGYLAGFKYYLIMDRKKKRITVANGLKYKASLFSSLTLSLFLTNVN